MAEYIKRIDVMKICEEYSEHCFDASNSRGQDIADSILDDVVEILAADVVEVPCRCIDCIKAMETMEKWNDKDKYFCDRHKSFVLADDFCSYGKRRDI